LSDPARSKLNATKLAKLLADLERAAKAAESWILPLGERDVKRLHEIVKRAAEQLTRLAKSLDPVAHPESVFDPTDPRDAAEIIGEQLRKQKRRPLTTVAETPFWGSGVYALYYKGDHPAYKPIYGTEVPIYVGKADPKKDDAATPQEQGTKLFDRLKKHATNIKIVQDYADSEKPPGIHRLALADFDCRFLVVHSSFAAASEASLISRFKPVWDDPVCSGFGKHGDSPGTRSNTRSEWDTLHPGRPWATRAGNRANPKTPKQIQADVLAYLRANSAPEHE
jgi:Eco29kI-like restriction endonuclease